MEDLEMYYSEYLPVQEICEWLSYGNSYDSKDRFNERDFLHRREFSFVLQGDVFCRYKSYRRPAELREALVKEKPIRFEIGAVYQQSPKTKSARGSQDAMEKEFIIDIDMDEYDKVRTCCMGSTVCRKCWKFLVVACRSIEMGLSLSFGFKNMLWVFSGRRGIHCWVSDASARRLNNPRRRAVIEFLNARKGTHTPFVQINDEVLLNYLPIIISEQNLFNDPMKFSLFSSITFQQQVNSSDPQKIKKGTASVNPDIVSILNTGVQDFDEFTDRLNAQLETREGSLKTPPQYDIRFSSNSIISNTLAKIGFELIYPKFDINVSTDIHHLLKSPFCVHPSTRKICVPFRLSEVDNFDPETVPTVDQVLSQADILRPYVEILREHITKCRLDNIEFRNQRIDFKRRMEEHTLEF
jgi:DNA primase small subunit